MSDIMAAIGRVQLKRFEELSTKRKQIALKYDEFLSDKKAFELLNHNYEIVNPHIYPIILNKNISRDVVRKKLKSVGVETGIHYYPNHLLGFFNKGGETILRNTDEIFLNIMTLPMHPDLSFEDVNYICENLVSITK